MAFQGDAFQGNAFQEGLPGGVAAGSGTYVSAAPQDGYGAREIAGYALIATLAVLAKTGSVGAAEYHHGTHAQQVYEAEGLKSQIRPPVQGGAPARVGTYVYTLPQDPTQLAPQISRARPAAIALTGKLGNYVQGSPQAADLTLQPQWAEPVQPPYGVVGAASYTFGTHQDALYNAESLKSDIWGSVRTPPAVVRPLGVYITAAPQQVDLTLPADIQPSVWAPIGYLIQWHGPDAQDDLTPAPQIWKSAAASLVPGRLGRYVYAAPELRDLTPPSQVWASVTAGPGKLAAYQSAAPQAVDLTQQAVWSVPVPAPPVVGTVGPASYTWGTHQEAIYNAEALKSAIYILPFGTQVAPPPPPPPPVETPAGRHRPVRYIVRVDGQEFTCRTVADAWQILTEAKRLAKKHALEVAAQAMREKEGKPTAPEVSVPKIATPTPELRAAVLETQKEIKAIYESALRDAEIRMWVELAKRKQDDDDLTMLFLM